MESVRVQGAGLYATRDDYLGGQIPKSLKNRIESGEHPSCLRDEEAEELTNINDENEGQSLSYELRCECKV